MRLVAFLVVLAKVGAMALCPRTLASLLGLSGLLSGACSYEEPLEPITSGTQTAGAHQTQTSWTSSGTNSETGPGDDSAGDGDSDGGPCAPDELDVDFSYLWVANTEQGSVSKIDTKTMIEAARYRTGPAHIHNSPSRTTVSLDGRFALVGNRMSGSVTLVAAELGDCVDTNDDDVITTSQDPDELLDWGDDECVLWSTALPDVGPGIEAGPRGMTFDPGEFDLETCSYENPKIWVGWRSATLNRAHVARIHPGNGAIEEVVDLDDWALDSPEFAPYGAAYDGAGGVWFTALIGEIVRLDTYDLSVQRWTPPDLTRAYGMTIDPEGKVWIGGCDGPVSVFDPETEIITAIPGTGACHRGLAADTHGNIWVASNDPCGLVQIDRETEQVLKFHSSADFAGECEIPIGVSVDAEGFVWMVDRQGWAWKINPESHTKELVLIPGDHYTYSDMTGGGLNAVVYPQ